MIHLKRNTDHRKVVSTKKWKNKMSQSCVKSFLFSMTQKVIKMN